ncbi:hypothetical protein [Burkholderia ubonensis]|uniref:Cytochrome c domain-containing protein n=1 Tax=Burkholderia ubonensis subsp. mesacidophila TaxID=265293 RepID=A0A2A4ET26_9BURK|nr:hypothetical protein [Burkholderia ubonensis]PCE24301.1 hypothetical protein BZL54_33925 [Burkholderia ubonensis subsp. mesacidophila]
MRSNWLIGCAVFAVAALLLAGCSGGSSNDVSPAAPPIAAPTGADMFLLFPNPQVQPDGSFQTNTDAYAQAYYAAIDPTNAKDTLDKWKAANGFGSGTGTEMTAVFGDVRDLGYGRRMVARVDPARQSIAFLVENYLTSPGGSYGFSSLSMDAAVLSDARWRIHYNAIEFSPGPNGGVPFAKFYNFDPVTGQRQLTIDMDGRGRKAMPAVCFSCHGGRADALTRDMNGNPVFGHVQYAQSQADGDAQARLQPFEVGSFDFSTMSGHTRVDYEAILKAMNKLVLCTYPVAAGAPAGQTNCPDYPVFNRQANSSEWQGKPAMLIRNAYGGNGLPAATYLDSYLPQTWSNAGQGALYRNVVAQSCRACHMLRGSKVSDEIDFDDFKGFVTYQQLIKHDVIDRGTMPLARIVYDNFWKSGEPELLASFLESPPNAQVVRDASGAVLQPGRPIADPGPDRAVNSGPTRLSAADSRFADTFRWTIVGGPAGGVLSDANSPSPIFTPGGTGLYVLQLVVSRGTATSAPAQLRISVNGSGVTDPSQLRLADILAVLQGTQTNPRCLSCHGLPPLSGLIPPLNYQDPVGLYQNIRSRINFTDINASPLLQKPAGLEGHGGGLQSGFDLSGPPTQASAMPVGRESYDLLVNWIMNGAPEK